MPPKKSGKATVSKRQTTREKTQDGKAEAELRKEEDAMFAAMRMIKSQESEEDSLQLKMQILAKTSSSSQVSTAATTTAKTTMTTSIITTSSGDSNNNNEDGVTGDSLDASESRTATTAAFPASAATNGDDTRQPEPSASTVSNGLGAAENGIASRHHATDTLAQPKDANPSPEGEAAESNGDVRETENGNSSDDRILIKPALRSGRRRKVALDEKGHAIQTIPPRPPSKKAEQKAWTVVNGTAVKLSMGQSGSRGGPMDDNSPLEVVTTTRATANAEATTTSTDVPSLIEVMGDTADGDEDDAMPDVAVRTAQGVLHTISAPELRETLASTGPSKDDQIKAIEELLFQKRSEAILATIKGHIPAYVPQAPPPPLGPDGKPIKRKPGRPPGYFLGPTSCAYCRQQHRRCDNQKSCARCTKAGIPCDRTGTVERPSVRSKELKIAKAIIECVEKGTPVPKRLQVPIEMQESKLASMVQAARTKMTPDQARKMKKILESIPFVRRVGKPRRVPVYMQDGQIASAQGSSTSAAASSSSSSSSSSAATAAVYDNSQDGRRKRRRSPSPSQISRLNIVEPNTKRQATMAPPHRFDPSEYDYKRKRRVASVEQDQVTAEETTATTNTKTGRPRGRPPLQPRSSSSAGSSNGKTVGRPAKIVKRAPGRPPKHARSEDGASSTMVLAPRKRGPGAAAVADTEDAGSRNGNHTQQHPTVKLVRKTFLKSGLYSTDLKTNAPLRRITGAASSSASSSTSSASKQLLAARRNGSDSKKHRPFFELPINFGETLINTVRDFVLPFDIMQAWKVGALSYQKQPDPFIKIRSNVFVERKRRVETSPMVCHCKRPLPEAGVVGCGEDCYNRVMFYECVSAHCPCGDQCSNQRFQKKNPNEDHLEVIWTEARGFGIRTTKPVKKGSLVIEYRGEVISQKLCLERMEGVYKNNKNFYFLEYEKGEVVDACQKGTNARFVNHSCSPNSQIEKWYLNGEMSIGIFASQDIPAGAEITYDYNFSAFQGAQMQECRCGAANCRGYICARSSGSRFKDQFSGDHGADAASPSSSGSGSGTRGGGGRRNGGGSGSGGSNGSGRKKSGSGRKNKASTRKRDQGGDALSSFDNFHASSVRFAHLPTVKTIRQRQSDKYKPRKMIAIRYTRLFLFRNIREVESKYVKYAQTKSRGFHEEKESRAAWLAQARPGRKRSLEGVIEDLRKSALEQEEVEQARIAKEEAEHKRQAEEEAAAEHEAAKVAAAEMAAAVGSAGETDSYTTGSVEPSELNYDESDEQARVVEDEVDELDGEDGGEEAPSSVVGVDELDEYEDDETTPKGYATAVSQIKKYLSHAIRIGSDGESPEDEGEEDELQSDNDSSSIGARTNGLATLNDAAKESVDGTNSEMDQGHVEELEDDEVEEDEVDELADDDGEESLHHLREAMLKKTRAVGSANVGVDG